MKGNCSVGLRIYCADRTKTWVSRQKSHCRRQFLMDFCAWLWRYWTVTNDCQLENGTRKRRRNQRYLVGFSCVFAVMYPKKRSAAGIFGCHEKKMNIDGYILTNLCTHLSKLGSGKVYTRWVKYRLRKIYTKNKHRWRKLWKKEEIEILCRINLIIGILK